MNDLILNLFVYQQLIARLSMKKITLSGILKDSGTWTPKTRRLSLQWPRCIWISQTCSMETPYWVSSCSVSNWQDHT